MAKKTKTTMKPNAEETVEWMAEELGKLMEPANKAGCDFLFARRVKDENGEDTIKIGSSGGTLFVRDVYMSLVNILSGEVEAKPYSKQNSL